MKGVIYIYFIRSKNLLSCFYVRYLSENGIKLQLICKKGNLPFEVPYLKKILKNGASKRYVL